MAAVQFAQKPMAKRKGEGRHEVAEHAPQREGGYIGAQSVAVSSDAISETQDEVVISGERNLLAVTDFSNDMGHLRRAFELFEQKAQLMRLLDVLPRAQ